MTGLVTIQPRTRPPRLAASHGGQVDTNEPARYRQASL